MIHYMNTQDHLAALGTKHLGKYRYRALIKLINDYKAWFIMNGGFQRFQFLACFPLHHVFSSYDKEVRQGFWFVGICLSIPDISKHSEWKLYFWE